MKGHIRQRGKHSWAIVIDIGYDGAGKRRQKWHSFRGPKREAQRELTRLLRELDTGAYVEPTHLTFADYLERWLAHIKQSVSTLTYERYADIARQHLIPAFGRTELSQLRPLHIQDFYTKALTSGRLDGRGGVSAQTVLHYHRVLHQALRQALRWQLIARNPVEAVTPPRPAAIQYNTLDEAMTGRLLTACEGEPLYMPVLIAAATGMRRGEILALRWADVDAQTRMIHVQQTLELTRAGIGFKQPKTSKSRRAIAIPAYLAERLEDHRREQAKQRLRVGPVYENLDLVCARADGLPWDPRYFSKAFKDLVDRTDIPKVRFHDLRHSHASQLLRQGVHPKVVSERLGHAAIAITLDRYSHVLPGLQEDAADRIDRALRTNLENRS